MATKIIGVRRVGDVRIRASDKGNVLEYTEEYTVQTDTPTLVMWHVIRDAVPDTGIDAYLTYTPNTSLPLPNYSVSSDGFAMCKELSGRREDRNANIWRFHGQWSSEVKQGPTSDDGTPPADLTDIVAQRETMFDVVRRPRLRDYTGRPYANSTGSLYVPALEVEEEISRFDWVQFEPVYTGTWTSGLPTTPVVMLDQVGQLTYSLLSPSRVVPPGIYDTNTYGTMIGVTDNTVAFFNGATNLFPFKGYPPFTLKLEVRKSVVGYFYGVAGRQTEYSIKYDPKNWLDKPVNAGPYFLGPRLNSDGSYFSLTDTTSFVKYDYVYYSKDVEDSGSNLSQDESGPLGDISIADGGKVKLYNSYASYDAVFGSTVFASSGGGHMEVFLPELGGIGPKPYLLFRNFAHNLSTGSRLVDGQPLGGYIKVKTAKGNWTLRAKRPPTNVEYPYIEYLNCHAFDFNGYLRVRYTY